MDNIYMICKCKNIIPNGRVNLGYKICVFGIDYDGKVEACGLEFNSASEVTEQIMKKIDSHFKISTSEDIK